MVERVALRFGARNHIERICGHINPFDNLSVQLNAWNYRISAKWSSSGKIIFTDRLAFIPAFSTNQINFPKIDGVLQLSGEVSFSTAVANSEAIPNVFINTANKKSRSIFRPALILSKKWVLPVSASKTATRLSSWRIRYRDALSHIFIFPVRVARIDWTHLTHLLHTMLSQIYVRLKWY